MLGSGCPPPLQPAPDPPPPRPEIGWKVGGSRRMARWYAPPVGDVATSDLVPLLLGTPEEAGVM